MASRQTQESRMLKALTVASALSLASLAAFSTSASAQDATSSVAVSATVTPPDPTCSFDTGSTELSFGEIAAGTTVATNQATAGELVIRCDQSITVAEVDFPGANASTLVRDTLVNTADSDNKLNYQLFADDGSTAGAQLVGSLVSVAVDDPDATTAATDFTATLAITGQIQAGGTAVAGASYTDTVAVNLTI